MELVNDIVELGVLEVVGNVVVCKGRKTSSSTRLSPSLSWSSASSSSIKPSQSLSILSLILMSEGMHMATRDTTLRVMPYASLFNTP